MIVREIFNKILEEHKQTFLRFCIIGGLATILNYSVFFVLYKTFSMNYLLSSAIGYLSGVFLGFGLNKRFTFMSESKKYALEIIKYLIVYTVSLFLGLAFLKALVYVGLNVLIANLLNIGLTTMTNYVGSKYFVFDETMLLKRANYMIYRYRYFLSYVIIGLSSIFIEIMIIELLKRVYNNLYVITVFGFIIGMLYSYFLNARLNFKVPKDENFRTFKWFIIISTFAFILNIVIIKILLINTPLNNYNISRFISAGCVFIISYTLHRKITFKGVKEVGIAIYLSAEEDVPSIKKKVLYYPDYIHIDLVDETFNKKAKPVNIEKGIEIQECWPKLMKMTHIMSKRPSIWLEKVAPFSDIILIHPEINENVQEVIKEIKKLGRKPGLSIMHNTSLDSIEKYLNHIKYVQMLGISKPGESSQHMEEEAIKKVDMLRKYKEKYNFDIVFDGGIRLTNIHKINAKYIVSGSTVLRSDDAVKAIHAIKTSSRYYYEREAELKTYLKKEILNRLQQNEDVISGTLVGSFVDKDGIEGISDIDIIVILDDLSKEKYDRVLEDFENLKRIINVDFDKNVIINPTLGPLKFNDENTVVFHLMIYDTKSHIEHCIKSPFTCLDWQRSKVYVKKSMAEVFKVYYLQPSDFISARRGIKDYSEDLKNKKISYREYSFKSGVCKQETKFKEMNNRDLFEFAYHIMKFVMSNYLKLFNHDNKHRSNEVIVKEFFSLFNSPKYLKLFNSLKQYKEDAKFPKWGLKYEKELSSFLLDFQEFFVKEYFTDCSKVYLIRHQKTKSNKNNFFIGQRMNPGIEQIDEKKLKQDLSVIDSDVVFSSPLLRCIETSLTIKKIKGIKEIIIEDDLKEIDYGDVDGKDLDYLKRNYPVLIKEWEEGKDPKFPNGENYNELIKRVSGIYGNICRDKRWRNKAICTHNVVIRCIMGDLCNINMKEWYKLDIPHLVPIKIIATRSNKAYLDLDSDLKMRIFKNLQAYS